MSNENRTICKFKSQAERYRVTIKIPRGDKMIDSIYLETGSMSEAITCAWKLVRKHHLPTSQVDIKAKGAFNRWLSLWETEERGVVI